MFNYSMQKDANLLNIGMKLFVITRRVAAGFGRHGMPPPAYDTGTAFCFPN